MILVHVQDIVKEAPTDASWPDVTAIPCEFMDNYESGHAGDEVRNGVSLFRCVDEGTGLRLGEDPGNAEAGPVRTVLDLIPHCLRRVVYRRSSPSVRARLTASSRLCTPRRWYKRSARSFAADREMPSLSAMTEKGTGCGR